MSDEGPGSPGDEEEEDPPSREPEPEPRPARVFWGFFRRFLLLFVVGFLVGTVVAGTVGAGWVAWRIAVRQAHLKALDLATVTAEVGPRVVPERDRGPLTGLVVYLSAGHGI